MPKEASPDGRFVALVKGRANADNNLYLADLMSSSAPKLITEHQNNISYGAR